MTGPAGLIIAAPSSGSGKTVITLGLLRALATAGQRVAGAKAGPDYIDPAFHAAATREPSFNLDPWAMRVDSMARLIAKAGHEHDMVLSEGVMGLFDGANLPGRPDAGSTADLAALTGWPVVLVINAAKQAASVAALAAGFARHRADVRVAGVIFNHIGSPAHEQVLRDAMVLTCPEIAVLGAVPRNPALALPERHLGLVQAGEQAGLEDFIESAAQILSEAIDLDALTGLSEPCQLSATGAAAAAQIPPPGQRVAIARDDAFAFAYPSVLEDWHSAGAELSFFSPLRNKAPDPKADAVYLPGGYPELHAGKLANAETFQTGLRKAAARGAAVFGECGGYMVLGQGMVDAAGTHHRMTGLLPLETSFAQRKLHLGYRSARTLCDTHLGRAGTTYRGHEFHYATVLSEDNTSPLFAAANARGDDLGSTGMSIGSVSGSFVHLIDRDAA